MSLWDLFQEKDLQDLRERMDRLQLQKDMQSWDAKRINDLAEEVIEARLRIDVLTRLLIAKGIFSAEDFAGLISQIRSREKESS